MSFFPHMQLIWTDLIGYYKFNGTLNIMVVEFIGSCQAVLMIATFETGYKDFPTLRYEDGDGVF